MSSARFKVLFRGEVVPGQNVEEVKKKIAAAFGVESGVVDGMFGGKLLARGNLTAEQAESYSRALTRAGAVCRVVPDGERVPARYVIRKRKYLQEMVCPKCGHTQPAAEECVRCGVILDKIPVAVRPAVVRRNVSPEPPPPQPPVSTREMQQSIRSDASKILVGCSSLVILAGVVIFLFGAFGFRSAGYFSPRFMVFGAAAVVGGAIWLARIHGEHHR